MAFTFTQSTEYLDGVRYLHVVVTEDDTTLPGDEWAVPAPEFGVITLVEADLEGAAGAATIRTALGAAPGVGWVVEGLGHIAQADKKATNVRIQKDQRIKARGGLIHGRSRANVALAGGQSIVTRITSIWGHK